MVLWGGLQPMMSQVAIDAITLIGLGFVTVSDCTNQLNGIILTGAVLLRLGTAGNLTNRWTMMFPIIPFLFLQGLRRWIITLDTGDRHATSIANILSWVVAILSILLLLVAAMLSILFPVVELAPILTKKYNVGVASLFLPKLNQSSSLTFNNQRDYVTVRILYPTLDRVDNNNNFAPYLKPQTAAQVCSESMKAGAPPPLQKFDWMLDNWRLMKIPAKINATPMSTDKGMPIVAFSHGLGGTAEIYTYQTMALASNGYIVLCIDHTDGSAPAVEQKDGTIYMRDDDNIMKTKDLEYCTLRRERTEYRSKEFIAAVESFLTLNERNIPELQSLGINLQGKLNTNEIHYMGHSFGGSTILQACQIRQPTSIVALEPVHDWLPNPTRRALFSKDRVAQLRVPYAGGTGGLPDDNDINNVISPSAKELYPYNIHDRNMLILFSHEWKMKKMGVIDAFEDLNQQGLLGPLSKNNKNNMTRVVIINEAYHNEFSDVCMLTPLWLARAVGVTGKRNPLETAQEIHARTLDFLQSVVVKN